MFDCHVHSAPDVVPRWGGDAEVVAAYAAAGFSGCVLKSHVEPTAGRAAVASAAVAAAGVRAAARDAATGRTAAASTPGAAGPAVYGGVVCNRTVGGVNPAAVATALALGGRVVWMPTVDAVTQGPAGLPRPLAGDRRVGAATCGVPPAHPEAEAAARAVCELVAEHDAVLATGHLSGAEVAWLLAAARQAGVQRLLLTHPCFTTPQVDGTTAAELCRSHGAYAEVTAYQLLHQPGMDAAGLAAFVRTVGTDRVVLSSDAGQPDSPPPPQALHRLVAALAAQGLDRGALERAASEVPAGLVAP